MNNASANQSNGIAGFRANTVLIALALVVLQGIFLWQAFPGMAEYRLYLPQMRWLAFTWDSIALPVLPIATVTSLLVAIGAKAYARAIGSAILVVLAGIMVMVSFILWWMYAYGYGFGYAVSEVAWNDAHYRLHYSVGGDPIVSSYSVLQCRPVAMWCRDVGMVVAWSGYRPEDPTEVQFSADKEIGIDLAGSVIASFDGTEWRCIDVVAAYSCVER